MVLWFKNHPGFDELDEFRATLPQYDLALACIIREEWRSDEFLSKPFTL
jgi:hypothetical protein